MIEEMNLMLSLTRRTFVGAVTAAFLVACDDSNEPGPAGFLDGTATDPGIAISIGSIGTTLLMLQTGDPDERREIPLGTSSTITAVGFSIRERQAAVPLGNAASVALIDLETEAIERYFTFPSGNATGSAWVDDNTVIACNQTDDVCGRFDTDQAADAITVGPVLTPFPTGVVTTNGRVFVISSNLDDSFAPIGPGVVTELDPATLAVVRTFTVGSNPQYGAVAPNGKLYVTNSGDFFGNNGTLSVINLQTNVVEGAPIPGFGDFPGPIDIDAQGRASISSFSFGTIVWNTGTAAFIRDPSDPLCAPDAGGCRTASDAAFAPNGNLYQSFFGSTAAGLAAYYFVYDGGTFALSDSIPVPVGPAGLQVVEFE
jgi:hypothetical protein